jgi:hypothetical protein
MLILLMTGKVKKLKSNIKKRKVANKFILKNKYGFTDEEIYAYQDLNNRELSGIEEKFISHSRYQEFRKYLEIGEWRPIVHNKWITANYYSNSTKISQPETYGILHPEFGTTLAGKPLLRFSDLKLLIKEKKLSSFVFKHIGGGIGESVYIIENIYKQDDELFFKTVSGEKLTEYDVNRLISLNNGKLRGFIIEERINLHTEINEITGGGLSSIRIYTLRTKNGSCIPKIAFTRFGVKGKPTDHNSNGGIVASVDIETGTVGEGFNFGEKRVKHNKHPDTGEKISGITLPYWRKAKNLVIDAANMSPGLQWVGWDVVCGLDKPFLIEGNVGGGVFLSQQLHGGFLTNGIFNDWVDHLVPEEQKESIQAELDRWSSRYIKKQIRNVLKPFKQIIS